MMIIHKKTKSGTIIGLLLLLYATIAFTPIIKNSLLLMILGVSFLPFVLSHSVSINYRKHQLIVLYVLLYLIICLLYRITGVSSIPLGQFVYHLSFFWLILVMLILPHILSHKQMKWVFWSVVLVVSLNILDNIRLCIAYPDLFFLVSRDKDDLGMNLNIGGSKFYNAVFFFFTICFFGMLNCNDKKYKYALLCSVVLSLIFIFGFCLKAAVLIFAGFSAFLLYFSKRAKSPKRFILLLLLPSLSAFVIVSTFSDQIIELISNFFSSERLSQRLIALIASDESETSTLEVRENLWLMSVNTWLDNFSNFIFGIGDHRANWDAGQTAAQTGIGQHSDFLDSLARYGLIGLLLLVSIFVYSFKYILSFFDNEYKLQLQVIFLLFVLFGFSKGVFQSDIGFVLFVLLPLLGNIINKKRKGVLKKY